MKGAVTCGEEAGFYMLFVASSGSSLVCSSRLYVCGQGPVLFGRVRWAWLWYVVDGELLYVGAAQSLGICQRAPA